MKNYSCLDGAMLETFVSPVADQAVGNDLREDLSAASGDEFYSGIIPLIAASQTKRGQELVKGTALDKEVIADRREARKGRRQARFDTRMAAKTARNQAKLTTAEGVKAAATDDSSGQLAQAISSPAPAPAKSNTMTYLLIGAAVLGIGYFVVKNMNKNKGK